MSLRGLAPLALLPLIACAEPAPKSSDKADAAASTPKSEEPPAKPKDVLSFGSAKIMRVGLEDRAFELAPDGTVTLANNPYAKLLPDGRMLAPTGEELMRVEADGNVVGSEGPTGILLVEGGGALKLPTLEVEVSFDQAGEIAVTASGKYASLLDAKPPLKSSGCTGEVTKACALITLVYLSALGNPESVKLE